MSFDTDTVNGGHKISILNNSKKVKGCKTDDLPSLIKIVCGKQLQFSICWISRKLYKGVQVLKKNAIGQ